MTLFDLINRLEELDYQTANFEDGVELKNDTQVFYLDDKGNHIPLTIVDIETPLNQESRIILY